LLKHERYDSMYMDIAERVGLMSHALRAKVGSIIVKDGNIISMGWNGMPAYMDNACEHTIDGSLVTNPEVLHSEENAIVKLTRSTNTAVGGTMYCTLSPCLACSKLIYGAGIARLVYGNDYKTPVGANFLRQRGVIVDKH
jgi:dCMP deaminase